MVFKLITDCGVLYSLWSGELKSYTGKIEQVGKRPTDGLFTNKIKRFGCSINPGEVSNAVVWLPIKDDEKAKNILIEYENNQILKLNEKIENHRHKIRLLQGDES